MTSTIEKYIPPAVFAGIVRGLFLGVGMGLLVSVPMWAAGMETREVVSAGILAALGALGFRTGEGALDARRDAKEYREWNAPVEREYHDIAAIAPLRRLTPEEDAVLTGIREGRIAWEDVENLVPVEGRV